MVANSLSVYSRGLQHTKNIHVWQGCTQNCRGSISIWTYSVRISHLVTARSALLFIALKMEQLCAHQLSSKKARACCRHQSYFTWRSCRPSKTGACNKQKCGWRTNDLACLMHATSRTRNRHHGQAIGLFMWKWAIQLQASECIASMKGMSQHTKDRA